MLFIIETNSTDLGSSFSLKNQLVNNRINRQGLKTHLVNLNIDFKKVNSTTNSFQGNIQKIHNPNTF